MANRFDRELLVELIVRMMGHPPAEVADAIVEEFGNESRNIGARKAEQIGETIGALVLKDNGQVAAVTDLGRVTWLTQNVIGPQEPEPTGLHPSHTVRSSDASSFDVICTECGATDISGAGWGRLSHPCEKPTQKTQE